MHPSCQTLGVALHSTEAAAEIQNAKCKISRARSTGCTGLAHYAARWWRMDLKTARSLRTHLPSRSALSSGRWQRASVGSGYLIQFEGLSSVRPSRFAGGRRAVAARSQGSVLCLSRSYRASAASCRMDASENTHPKLAVAAFCLGFKSSGLCTAADA